jgi:predicted chitinase
VLTENRWPACGPDLLDRNPIPGTDVVIALQRGQPNIILKAFAADLNWYVESVYNSRGGSDEGGWTATNSVPTSNHLGGTAFDYNWSDHPMGIALDGWWGSDIRPNQPQEPFVRELLEYYEGTVFWGNDWKSPKDSMHFQMGYDTYGNPHTQDFINRKIRKDGFSRFKETKAVGQPTVDVALLLGQLMGPTPGVDYSQFVQAVEDCLRECGCTTVKRIAMWAAQVGTESAGLKYMEEIASGAAYEGRTDLGNTQPGDGVRFKGRGPIQVTGRSNYTKLSKWCFDNGMVPTPTYFVDNPGMLASPKFGFMGVTWYWTTQRPMNDAADAGNVELATRYVNGGNHGLPDRKARYASAMNMGDRLLALVSGEEDFMADEDIKKLIREIHRETVTQSSPSRSFMAEDGKNIDSPLGIAWNTDANAWTLVMTEAYRLDVPLAVTVVEDIAENGVRQTSWAGVNDFNEWLREFGQAYCAGLVAEKAAKDVAPAKKAIKRKPSAK